MDVELMQQRQPGKGAVTSNTAVPEKSYDITSEKQTDTTSDKQNDITSDELNDATRDNQNDATKNTWKETGISRLVIRQICEHAVRYGVNKVILFGSRSRGDFRRGSDIDLAASGGEIALFHLALEEDTDTLLTYDVVNLDQHLKPGLREIIETEGILLYEKI